MTFKAYPIIPLSRRSSPVPLSSLIHFERTEERTKRVLNFSGLWLKYKRYKDTG